MKKVIQIIYCDLGDKVYPSSCKYQRVACEFLLGTNYVNCLLKYIANSGLPSSLGIIYVGNTAVGYKIYLDYKQSLKC